MSSTERVRKWRAEQRRKAQLYDQLEAARRAHLERQAVAFTRFARSDDDSMATALLTKAVADPLCFDIHDQV